MEEPWLDETEFGRMVWTYIGGMTILLLLVSLVVGIATYVLFKWLARLDASREVK